MDLEVQEHKLFIPKYIYDLLSRSYKYIPKDEIRMLLLDHGYKKSIPYINYVIKTIKGDKKIKQKNYRKEKSEKDIVSYRTNTLYNAAKRRASKFNLDFNITKLWIKEKLLKGKCEKTGLNFIYNKYDSDTINPYTPSLDRIIPEKGYIKSNVQVVLLNYNRLKNDADEKHALKIAAALVYTSLISEKDKVVN